MRRTVRHRNALGAGSTNLFGVFEVLEERVMVPGYTLAHVCGSVRVALGLTSLPAEEPERQLINDVNFRTSRNSPVKVRSDFMGSTLLDSVALSASSLEETSTLSSVTYDRTGASANRHQGPVEP